jgi:hypothetical protein
VRFATRVEQAGFGYASISDHLHPWMDAQGQSPFVWSVLGGIATATSTLRVGTGVTCPTHRYHPAIVAQAAATVATMMPGRLYLGVGTGEALNEHVVDPTWPVHPSRGRTRRPDPFEESAGPISRPTTASFSVVKWCLDRACPPVRCASTTARRIRSSFGRGRRSVVSLLGLKLEASRSWSRLYYEV